MEKFNSDKDFNPSNPKYKKVDDLPERERGNYVDVTPTKENPHNGFVTYEAMDRLEKAQKNAFEKHKKNSNILEKILLYTGMREKKVEQDAMDELHIQALRENEERKPENILLKEYKYFFLDSANEVKVEALDIDFLMYVRDVLGIGKTHKHDSDENTALYVIALAQVGFDSLDSVWDIATLARVERLNNLYATYRGEHYKTPEDVIQKIQKDQDRERSETYSTQVEEFKQGILSRLSHIEDLETLQYLNERIIEIAVRAFVKMRSDRDSDVSIHKTGSTNDLIGNYNQTIREHLSEIQELKSNPSLLDQVIKVVEIV